MKNNHSMFANCSRIFSSVLFISITTLAISVSLDLEPIVLTSRLISWVMNSSFRPTGSAESNNFLN